MKIKKYGGSSLSDINKIKNVAKDLATDTDKQLVVVSAPFGFTNDIIKKANEISSNPSKREVDQMIVTGEMINASLLCIALNELGIKAYSCNAYNLGLYASNDYGNGRIINIDKNRILNLLEQYDILVITGFQGMNEKDFVSLGRGSSDTTALALAALFKIPCKIYTDVKGVYTIDPKLGIDSKKLPYISYEEMLELSLAGGKVLADKAATLAYEYKIPTDILESLSNSGTKVTDIETYGPKSISTLNVTKNIQSNPFLVINSNKYYKVEGGEYSVISVIGSYMIQEGYDKIIEKILSSLNINPDSLLFKENLLVIVVNKDQKRIILEEINKNLFK